MSLRSNTRKELLEAAAMLFEQKGYAGTSIREIAKACDTSISNIYHHFGNKEGLWQEIRNASVTNLPGLLRAARARYSDPVKGFTHMLRTHLEAGDEFRRNFRIFFLGYDQVDPSPPTQDRLQREITDIYIEQVTELRKLGYAKSRHPKVAAFNVLGVMNWSLRWYRADGKLSAKKIHDEIVTFILRALGIGDVPGRAERPPGKAT